MSALADSKRANAQDRAVAAPTVTQASLDVTANKPPPKAPPKTPGEGAPTGKSEGDKAQSDKAPSAEGKLPSDTTRLPQFDRGMEFTPKGPNEKVAFSLEDADLSELLRVIGEITGRRFVVATNKIKSFKATVYSPQKITVTEAYQAFLSILQSNGLTTLPAGGFWKIVDTQDIAKQATPVARRGEAATAEERYVTRIHRLEHVNAEEVVNGVLSKFQTHDGSIVTYPPGNLLIMTDTGENIRRMSRILEDIDIGSATDKVWLEPLFYVPAADVEKKLSDIFDMKKDAKDATAKNSGMGELRLSKIVPLERPNALVIVGSETSYKRALEFIKRIDVQVTSEGDIHVVPLEHTDAKKIVTALNEAVQGATAAAGATPGAGKVNAGPLAILDSPVKISAEETTNSILVTSSEHDFAAVREVIAKLDKPRRQVYIEAVVMDVSVTNSTGFGVKWHGADLTDNGSLVYGGVNPLSSAGAPAGEKSADLQGLALGIAGPSVTALGMTIPAFGALIEAHVHTDDFDVLQTPHILCTDNMPAEIHSQLNTSLQQNAPSLSSLGGSSGTLNALSGLGLGTAPASANYGKIGPKLKITPHLNASDEVRLDVEETISDLAGDPQGTLGVVPFLERAATTTLTVRDQQTVVIGGLVRDKTAHSTTKVPILGDIPILGALFRQKSTSTEKSNLVLVLTPYIIREQDDLRRIYERKMQERQDFIDHTELFGQHDYEPPKDYTRTRGLLEEVRQAGLHAQEQRRIAESIPAAQTKTHEPSAPLDLPAPASAPPVSPAAPNGSTTPITPTRNANAGTGAPAPGRTLDRVER